jgi:hypothetical protein
MKCLYVIHPGYGATDEEREQLQGLIVVKVYELEGAWKVNPPAIVTFSVHVRDCVGNYLAPGKPQELLVPSDWLIPLDCSRTKNTESLTNQTPRLLPA